MIRLEDLTKGTRVRGLHPAGPVEIVSVTRIGADSFEVYFKTDDGRPESQLVFRDQEPQLQTEEVGRAWSFTADPHAFKLAAEALRIRLAHLFDPLLAVHTSLVEPLPHQITAVYESMLSRQPLRFLLADDPGAGKTIMTGLLIKELMLRGDLERCLIVCPGNLVEQWQDELSDKFGLPFEIATNDKMEAARTGNWFTENDLCIGRLDKLARDEDLHQKLERTDWDLVVCDEAHKMSATFFGGEVKYTKRFHLGRLLSGKTRHFLLLTATPHNGKEQDFQLFMSLLDGDRFEGKFRDGVHTSDTKDLMRRMVKEELVKFDGKPLFPERRAITVSYTLSNEEAALYHDVTEYVREEFNRADALENDRRKGTVGFALTILQRRLASSPEAIYQSLKRRRERLATRLEEEQLLQRGAQAKKRVALEEADWADVEDLEDLPAAELEDVEEQFVDQATARRTIEELRAEIDRLAQLEAQAQAIRRSGRDRKWDELSELLGEHKEMFDSEGRRRKLVIFTEHRDTLNYLAKRIGVLLGDADAIVTIHGGMGREERRRAQTLFTQDKRISILIATDAAGEGINLQRAHLMVNYDLPWNPNRLEQRFGRIHRIGQTEVCHLWNLVAGETREGAVFQRLLEKVQSQAEALGGKVFDVLGKLSFDEKSLRELLMEAIRYGDREDVRSRLDRVIDDSLDPEHISDLYEQNALARDSMSPAKLQKIREDMERAEARRLQPHYISSFFLEALRRLGGRALPRESKRYEVTRVPQRVRERDRQIGTGAPLLTSYERIAFEKDRLSVEGKPLASFVCPGHPLLDATLDLTLEELRPRLKEGAVLVDPSDPGEQPRVLIGLEHAIRDSREDRQGRRLEISRRALFVELHADGRATRAGYAPYLEYEPLAEELRPRLDELLDEEWLRTDLEPRALRYASEHLAPEHLREVRERREEQVEKTRAAVKMRLTKEIAHWDARAQTLREQEAAGKQPKMNSQKAAERAQALEQRLERRMRELDLERQVSAAAPRVVLAALVVPAGLVRRLAGEAEADEHAPQLHALQTQEVERAAMDAVMAAERANGYEVRDLSAERCGYDVESRDPQTGRLRFIEVKGRSAGARDVILTRNEVLTALNKPESWWLALVEVEDGRAGTPRYVSRPFGTEPDFGTTTVSYRLDYLLSKGESA